jgi:hypothetical protein
VRNNIPTFPRPRWIDSSSQIFQLTLTWLVRQVRRSGYLVESCASFESAIHGGTPFDIARFGFPTVPLPGGYVEHPK